MEFIGAIADAGADGNTVGLSPGLFQPIAAEDVSALVADIAPEPPRGGIVDIAGPDRAPLDEIVARFLKAVGDPARSCETPTRSIGAAGLKSFRWCRSAKRASAASI